MKRLLLALVLLFVTAPAAAQETSGVRLLRDSVVVDFFDADLRNVIQALARYMSKPVLASNVPSVRVTLQTPQPVSREQLRELLRGVLESNHIELVEEPAFFRLRERPAPAPPAPPPIAQVAPQAQRDSTIRLYVIRLRHANAVDVAVTVNSLFGGGGNFSYGGISTGTLSDELRRMRVPDGGVSRDASAAPTGGGEALVGPVTIVPDPSTNSLLLRATAPDEAVIRQAVDELDIRPLQVLIEVLIIEARRDHTFSLGADIFVPPQSIGNNATGSAAVTGGGLGDMVIKVLNVGGANVNATIRAAESRGQVQIVSRPVLLASNNTEATLLVGSQRPFVQVSRTIPTDAATRDQVVQYRDVGTRLTVRPTINHDGYVSLQIQQEVNVATSEVQFDAPVISTREAATRVLMHDGQTVVIGGLRDQQRDVTRRGVPLLSQLPLIGGLFGSVERRQTATELYLFITPRILLTDADADSVTTPRLSLERP